MDYIILKARAKINIALDVLGILDNGYHELRMIMENVNLCDTLFIKKTVKNDISLRTNLVWLPCDNKNLAYRAAQIIIKNYDIKSGVQINLTKEIPVAAGLAGGSADCAATLIGMRNLFNLNIPIDTLIQIGKELGADVPYCIMRGSVLAEGIGEKLKKLPPFPYCYILLAKPPINVSTQSVFNAIDSSIIEKRPNIDKIISGIKRKDLKVISDNMCNVLENVTIKNYPIIADIKQSMLNFNAIGSMMSGSGPTVFGLFTKKYDAVNALRYIRKEYKIKEAYVSTIFNTTTFRKK